MAGRQRFTEKQRKVRHRQANSRYYARNIEQCREKARLYAQARRIRPKQQEKADVAGHTDAGQSLPPTDSLPMPTSSGNVEVKQASTVEPSCPEVDLHSRPWTMMPRRLFLQDAPLQPQKNSEGLKNSGSFPPRFYARENVVITAGSSNPSNSQLHPGSPITQYSPLPPSSPPSESDESDSQGQLGSDSEDQLVSDEEGYDSDEAFCRYLMGEDSDWARRN
ncbi:hypothetical protein FPV67DRAFT_1453987 [Lyophyllum atratum]|nr:hypothetical protein FPV67DRAFT_1453987 [Lyophyllum atratum]